MVYGLWFIERCLLCLFSRHTTPDTRLLDPLSINHKPSTLCAPMPTPIELVDRSQTILAHAWMVRTFVKHSTEVEDFPELMGIVRAVFDLSRAVEPRVGDPAEYFKMLDKKLPELKRAVEKFAIDAPHASTHTNFAQAVISIRSSTEDLAGLLVEGLRQTSTVKVPISITKPIPKSTPGPGSASLGTDSGPAPPRPPV